MPRNSFIAKETALETHHETVKSRGGIAHQRDVQVLCRCWSYRVKSVLEAICKNEPTLIPPSADFGAVPRNSFQLRLKR